MAIGTGAAKGAGLRLIEAGFPCHQVGAETARERGASSSLPPLYFLHVWWARRPLTPSRAAVLASLLPADTDTDWFLRQLGIERVEALVNGQRWVLTGKLLERITEMSGREVLPVDKVVLRALESEQLAREANRDTIGRMRECDSSLATDPVMARWERESQPVPKPWPHEGEHLGVIRVAADPAWFNQLMEIGKRCGVRVPNLYGYDRAYKRDPERADRPQVVLDPTSGGGSIPFEALRLGHRVIANELNPVAAVILHATLVYPTQFGFSLCDDIRAWGDRLLQHLDHDLDEVFPRVHPLPPDEQRRLQQHLQKCPDLVQQFNTEGTTTYLFARQVTCPHCKGEAPLLNTCWLSKEEGDEWGVRIVPDGKQRGGKVRFETYRVSRGRGPKGEDPDFATVDDGTGQCIHCRQSIDGDEVKAQARGESTHGQWRDRLYAVVAVRLQPKLDSKGKAQRYKSGERAGEIKTEKVRFFRPPNEADLAALDKAERRLKKKWPEWEAAGLIPTEEIPPNSNYNRGHRLYGVMRWCDMFTPRQLLGHLTLTEELNRLKPQIMEVLGDERGRAVVTYLQFAIDKGLDYNSTQTQWHALRGVLAHTFTRHNFAMQWIFGEMIFAGPYSGSIWALNQIVDSYASLADLHLGSHEGPGLSKDGCRITCGTAASLQGVSDGTVDLICMDPPYYDNVMYAELSDFFYVWQRRSLRDLYPDLYTRRLTDKRLEAVASTARDGSREEAKAEYQKLMREIFAECHRVLRGTGVFTIMFTHKTQDAWEALTRSLVEEGWAISAAMPVESEGEFSVHVRNQAAVASSIFLTCRKRAGRSDAPAMWAGFGGTGVQHRVQEAVAEALEEFESLHLPPVDEQIACYGRALRVLSEQWPVLDGDEPVSPTKAMLEASRVVAEHQIRRLTQGRLRVEDLHPEAAMSVTIYGIAGLGDFDYDQALNLSRSLNIRLEAKAAGYRAEGRIIGINQEERGRSRSTSRSAEETGYHAPLIRKGSKLRLATPEERHARRMEDPQTEWDVLHGMILAHRRGDVPVARAYLDKHARGRQQIILDLLSVWIAEAADEKLRREGQALGFGLKGNAG